MNNQIFLFTDGSVNPQSKIGYGAYIAVSDIDISNDALMELVKVKRFEETSSTKLELQTLLWALKENDLEGKKVILYTDSQNVIGLPGRRARFEKNDYYSKSGKRIGNYKLYQDFYQITDQIDFELHKVIGHKASKLKDVIDRIFNLVDKASRKALRDSI